MEVHFQNILAGVKFSDYSFQNPVELRLEAGGPVVGSATLEKRKNQLFADIVLTGRVDYLEMYPRLAIDAGTKQIGYVFLSKDLPIDPEVKILKDQICAQPTK